jgi:hypothetical protein
LAKHYRIKPWEINEDHEVYPEDLNSLIAFHNLEVIASKKSDSEKEARGNIVEMFKKR